VQKDSSNNPTKGKPFWDGSCHERTRSPFFWESLFTSGQGKTKQKKSDLQRYRKRTATAKGSAVGKPKGAIPGGGQRRSESGKKKQGPTELALMERARERRGEGVIRGSHVPDKKSRYAQRGMGSITGDRLRESRQAGRKKSSLNPRVRLRVGATEKGEFGREIYSGIGGVT